MDQIVSQIFAPFVNIATNLIKTHLGYAIRSTKHVNNMRNKMKVLEDTSADVKKHMDTNKINDEEIPTGVPDWLNDVKDLKKKVESISSDGIGCLNMKMRYRAGRNAFKATEAIEELIIKLSVFTWTDAPIPTGRVMNPQPVSSTTSPAPSSSSGGNVFKSRDVPFNDALKFLQQDDDKTQVIALCGMGGVGKTTMMKQLKDDIEVKTRFRCIVNVAIGRDPNMYSIQNDIALCLGGEGLREETITKRADGLCRRFKNLSEDGKKKILVILDDVWEKVELQDIGLTSPLPKGVKLLLTSRDSNICQQIAVDACSDFQEVKVDVLKEAEANNFFSRITQVSEEDDREKYLIGCDIVKKCGCLPLAIKLIASTLKSKEDYVWRNTLNRLKNNDDIDKVQEVIRISYEHIEEYEEKQIFLHCGLFPEDYNIPIEDLTRHAWGLKLLGNVSNLREARDRVKTCVSNLINANLLIRSDDVTCVKMHDLVLAFVLKKVSRGHDHVWLINHSDLSKWGREETSESCQRISVTCKGLSQFPRDFKYPNLSLIQLMHGDYSLKFPEDFYENMEKLEVISYINMMCYPPLPRSLQCSTNLKSLCLYDCKLMFNCPFIGDLVNLEVLSFAYCVIGKLPSTIGNLRKLKLLDLTECKALHIEDGVFRNLENLEELYMIANSIYGMSIRLTDANLEELKMPSSKLRALEVEFVGMNTRLKNFSFTQLCKFKIAIGCWFGGYRFNRNLSKNTLKLATVSKNKLHECKINELFKKTESLYLQVNDMIGLEDIVSIHPKDQYPFCYLRDLEVHDCVKLKYLCTLSLASGLRKLESLTVSSCSSLEALVHNDGREINCLDEIVTFDKLKFLSLKNLPKLVSLFLIDNAVELPQLVVLILDGLPNFTSIYPDKNNNSTLQQPFLNNQVRIPGLKILKVASMEKLKQIWACNSMEEEVNNISTLREIDVRKCDSLVNLFPINPMRLLNHLEKLMVEECASIEVIFNIDMECFGHEVSKSSLRDISVYYSRNVREVWRIKNNGNNANSICGFDAVESIEIICCERFRNVFTPSNTKFDMRALTHSSISPDNLEAKVGGKEGDDSINSTVAFPSNFYMDTFQNLRTLYMGGYDDVEVVFEMDSPSSGELITNNEQPLLLLPNLQELELIDMQMMTHVWKWNKFLILQNQSSFHKLTTIKMSDCHKIKYLLSPLMTKLLSNLQGIYISNCDGMEEVVSNRDEEITTYTTTTFYPCLHSLSFSNMRNLKSIGGGFHDKFKLFQVGVISWSLCQYSRQIEIYSCDALSSVIPYYAIGEMQNLQVLKVYFCASLIEVFETQGINSDSGGASSSTNIDEGIGGNDTTTLANSRLENINVAKLSNLKELVIVSCDLLQHVFTFSTLESLKQLEVLTVKGCEAMKVIVKKENEEQNKVVIFPHLKSLRLIGLPNLNGFFLGKNEFHWLLLETVMISQCPQMIMFTYHHSVTPKLKYIHTRLGKHSLECGLNFHVTRYSHQTSTRLESLPWSFHNLIEIDREGGPVPSLNLIETNMKGDGDIKNIIPFNELLHLRKLERIRLIYLSYVKEVFEVEAAEETNSESQTHFIEIPNLTQVELWSLRDLKYIWKSSHHGRTTVVLKFPNLTILSINQCNELKHVFTSSMVRSLQQLQELHISVCSKMEVIVKVEESTFECDDKVSEIVKLPCLKSLKLQKLAILKGFCLGKDEFSCPSLHTLEIRECPEITVFTKGHLATPALNVIDTGFGRFYLNEDINSFILTNQDALSYTPRTIVPHATYAF